MSDVDAIRRMASEHDLEFVDLDTYGVDPAAGEILPASLARKHHVVAIKRKFGTPVIATAEPDDLTAQDSVRASIGRDFISVVAAPDQIGNYLDQLFGAEDEGPVAPEIGVDGSGSDEREVEPEAEPVEASVLVDEHPATEDPFADLVSDQFDGSRTIVEEAESAIADDLEAQVGDIDEPGGVVVDDPQHETGQHETGLNGTSALEISPLSFDDADWQEFPAEAQVNGNGGEGEALATVSDSASDLADLGTEAESVGRTGESGDEQAFGDVEDPDVGTVDAYQVDACTWSLRSMAQWPSHAATAAATASRVRHRSLRR